MPRKNAKRAPNPYRRGIRAISEEELLSRLELIPEDTRDYTGKMMGDPIPNDKRRLECKSMETVKSVESTH